MNYAQLNEQNQCVGISQLSGEVTAPNLIPIPTPDPDLLGQTYQNGAWLPPNPETKASPPQPKSPPDATTALTTLTQKLDLLTGGLTDIYETLLGGE